MQGLNSSESCLRFKTYYLHRALVATCTIKQTIIGFEQPCLMRVNLWRTQKAIFLFVVFSFLSQSIDKEIQSHESQLKLLAEQNAQLREDYSDESEAVRIDHVFQHKKLLLQTCGVSLLCR